MTVWYVSVNLTVLSMVPVVPGINTAIAEVPISGSCPNGFFKYD